MATVLNRTNHFKKDIRWTKIKILLQLIKLFILIILYLCSLTFDIWDKFVSSYIALGYGTYTIFRITYLQKKKSILANGLEGEKYFLKVAEKLPKSYTILTDLDIGYKGNFSQLDMIVVGDNGVFIIEIKNIRGTITGHVNDHDLTQTKINRDGKTYIKTIYNPIKQVETHRERLKDILKSNKINTPIENIVAFVNKDIHLNLQGKSSTKLFTIRRGKEHLIIQYLVDFKRNTNLNKNEKDKIIQSILSANK